MNKAILVTELPVWMGEAVPQVHCPEIRDWSLITGRGGYKREGGVCEVLPLRKGWEDGRKKFKSFSRGGTKSFGVVFTW